MPSITESSLGHLPGEKWEFDESVTNVFPDMLERSIPQYHVMRQMVFDAGRQFVQPGTDILDLGCSRGDALDGFMTAFGAQNRYIGVDVSEPMLAQAKERFASWPAHVVKLMNLDLRKGYPVARPSLTLMVLTLMFTPINYRTRIVRDAYASTVPGGAVILVEKLLGKDARVDAWMQAHYHAMKAANGYTQEEIDRKALALEGVQVPLSAEWNEDLLIGTGFQGVECLWRWCNFAMWIGVKP